MKKTILLSTALATAALANAQTALDAYQFSQSDLKGTARYMSMGGAFGALGGDLSAISLNPGGIGVYRSNEIGFTLNLDAQSSKSTAGNLSNTLNQTKFLLNNIGGVATLRLNNSTVRNLNFGFTYNKAASFNRQYGGSIGNLQNSMSNYIAGISNANDLTVGDVTTDDTYDPYNPSYGSFISPWISILGYDSYLVSPVGDDDAPHWMGQWGAGTTGTGSFLVNEKGAADEYNISFGGNISDVFFWGMDFGIVDFNYTQEMQWGENLQNAWVENRGALGQTSANWNLYNYYNLNGNGFNYKLGFIIKPIQELRIGFAMHTPTWYNMTETFYGRVDYNYGNDIRSGNAQTNNGYDAYNSYNFRTPWRLVFSAAGVVSSNFILSADYIWEPYNGMRFSDNNEWGSGDDAYAYENGDIKSIYKATNTLRVGAEYRITPRFSIRAGYSYVSSPVKASAINGQQTVYPSGTRLSYSFDNATNYVTCGLGYRVNKFSIDLAYVYKHRTSDFHAYPSDPESSIPSPTASITHNNSQIVLTAGLRF